jgi:hypothetical protein
MNYSESVIVSRRAADDASGNVTAQVQLFILVSKAILTACNLGNFTCTASVSGATSQDLQALLETLNTSGYQTSVSGTTLTVNW